MPPFPREVKPRCFDSFANDQVNSVVLSLNHPRLLTSLILMDPIIQKENAGILVTRASSSRRDIWPSREAAAEKFSQSKFYQTWDPRVMKNWVKYGLRDVPTELYPADESVENDTRVTLTTSKHQEIFQYLRPSYREIPGEQYTDKDPYFDETYPDIPFYRPEPLQAFNRLPELRPGVLYILGGKSEYSTPEQRAKKMGRTGSGVGGSGGASAGRVKEVILDCGHLVAMEKVGECADAITAFLKTELQKWNEDKEAMQKYLSSKTALNRVTIDEEWKTKIKGNTTKL